ncbi:cupin domain-containing protein [Aquirufa aurantiipilula]|uniref:Cupin domain-containing protein n=1 Tax=Aquirufa aurantiipilula TaxID=2696561 RepID=A0ABT6BQA2_9BACT|nr:cupin domain-containing protein [Aquirufa aurantiipilula]MBZ1325657.1 cupin domain-containing protein [Aquirufa aurantiipilula]MDF5691528.1 cupin domain-containing protein [Aquirufa aurantiipilula]
MQTLIPDQDIPWSDIEPGIQRKIMAHNDQLMLIKVRFSQGAIGSLHHHPHTQASYVSKGKFEVTISGDKKILQAGDVYFVPSQEIHGVICLEDGELIDVFNPAREDFL